VPSLGAQSKPATSGRYEWVDEFTHECLAIRANRKLKAIDVIDVLSDLFILRGVPGHIRSDNGPEFVAKAVQEWIGAVSAKTAYIEPGSPWENGYIRILWDRSANCTISIAPMRSCFRQVRWISLPNCPNA
jgi:transposase InsO family protein